MTTLRLTRMAPSEIARSFYPCASGCMSRQQGAVVGTVRAFLLDHPAGFLCESCAVDWQRAWEDATGDWIPIAKVRRIDTSDTEDDLVA